MNQFIIRSSGTENFKAFRRTRRLGVLTVLAALTCAAIPARAAVREAWVQRYNSVEAGGNDRVSKVVRDAAGDIIVAGGTDNHTTGHDLLTIKYAGTNGAVIWQHRYNGPGNRSDGASALAVDGNGNVVVAGFSSNGTNNDFYTAKYSGADGTLIWENRYAGAANGNDSATAMVVDENGNVVVTGFSSSFEQNSGYYPAVTNDFYTAKYAAADGVLLWERRYNGPADGDDVPKAMAVDAGGNVVVTGSSMGADTASDFYTAKYAGTDGALLWERRSDSPPNRSELSAAVTMDHNGNVVVTGSSYQITGVGAYYTSDYYTAKYSAADGALLWEQRYDGPGHSYDAASAVLADSLGNVIVTGASKGIGDFSGFYTAKYSGADGAILWDRWSTNGGSLLALDDSGNVAVAGFEHTGGTSVATFAAADGALLWERTLRNGQWDSPAAIAVSGNGEVVVTRNVQGSSHKDYHWFTTKMASNGLLLWQQKYDGPANGHDRAVGLAIDRSGNVAVTGTSITAKYAAADGALLWKKQRGELIAVDDADNVILVGRDRLASEFVLWLVKYSPDGEFLWEQHRQEPSQLLDYAAAMVVDRNGNVVITGWSYKRHSPGYGADYFTAKYAANDGALLWETSYNGPADSEDRASAVAVDQEGNVVVTGVAAATAADGFGNYYTAKYAATDGALLWEKQYNGPANGGESAKAIAVDGSGNVIVTGSSHNGTNTDYATVKYAAANGALLWERRFNGPANSDDEANALAVDGNGDVVVIGSSSGSDRVTDFYTAKYGAASGAVLWEKRYHNPANSYGRGQKVVVDANGDAIVSGDSGGSYYTAKYATANGALLWEKRLDVPPNRAANVAGLGVGPDGMVAVTGLYVTSFVDGVLPDLDYVTVVYRENRPPVTMSPPVRLANGRVRLEIAGEPGERFVIQMSSNLRDWATIGTRTASAEGVVTYEDPDAGRHATRFYRVVVE